MSGHIRNEKSRLIGTYFLQIDAKSHYVPVVEIFISRIMYFVIIYVSRIKSMHRLVCVYYMWKTPSNRRGFWLLSTIN